MRGKGREGEDEKRRKKRRERRERKEIHVYRYRTIQSHLTLIHTTHTPIII